MGVDCAEWHTGLSGGRIRREARRVHPGVTLDVVYFSAGCLMLALLLIGAVGDLLSRE